MHEYTKAYLAGRWTGPLAGNSLTLHDSYTEAPIGTVALAGEEVINAAVAAARDAFPQWSAQSPAYRAELLEKVGAALASQVDTLAPDITREVGMPLKLSRRLQVQAPAAAWQAYAGIARQFPYEAAIGHSLVTRVPVGVVGCITPWNYPLHQITAKVAPALGAGCTVVLKPSELAPAGAFALAQAIHAAGFPPGVFNMVLGDGPGAGEALCRHGEVDMISFTGSTTAGRRVASLAGQGIKRVALELGGKSASIVLPGADMPAAARHALSACFINSGQTCNAITRLLVPASQYEECLALLARGVETFAMGDPLDAATRLGPLVSARQRDQVRAMVDRALAAGARLATPDASRTVPARGYFVAPTVLADVSPDAEIARQEVFGPVLAVMPYTTTEQAIELANGTDYGLAAAVWAADEAAGMAVARRLRAGQVDVNGAPFNPAAPFGGFRLSGVGRENGVHGFEEFLQSRAIQRPAEWSKE